MGVVVATAITEAAGAAIELDRETTVIRTTWSGP